MLKRFENRFAIFASFDARGVTYGVQDGRFFVRAKRGVLTEDEKIGVDVCRDALREALWYKQGLCLICGQEQAKRPKLDGYAGRKGTPNGNVIKRAPDYLKEQYPPLWCDACYNEGAPFADLLCSVVAERIEQNACADEAGTQADKAPPTIRQNGFAFTLAGGD